MILFPSTKTRFWLISYWLLLLIYAIFSYGLTAPNLILINSEWFMHFQTWMWTHLFNQRAVLSQVYLYVIGLLFLNYVILVHSVKNQDSISLKQQLTLVLIICVPLLFSNNALSYDVFNYIFNSRMIVKYQANPHTQTALNFAFDDWTRFMHNTHTPAPYGYGWSFISLLPYIASQGKFILAWLNFRLFSIISICITSAVIHHFAVKLLHSPVKAKSWFQLFFNPLFLIEIVSNSHNDLWMMFPAILAVYWINIASASSLNKRIMLTGKGFLIWIISVSTKMASLALAPLLILIQLFRYLPSAHSFKPLGSLTNLVIAHQAEVAAFLMFLPLLTTRSQLFHPWYLIWPLVWLPLIKSKSIKILLLVFSFTSLLRYYPWLLTNSYTTRVLQQQRLITWSALPLSGIWFIFQCVKRKDWFHHLFQRET